MSCHLLAPLAKFGRSYALLSTNVDTETAVIFLHGFFGDSWSTWNEFQIMVDGDQSRASFWGTADLYFHEYSAARNFVAKSAQDFLPFVTAIYPHPSEEMFTARLSEEYSSVLQERSASIRKPLRQYQRLILVAHSVGAVVVRQCIASLLRTYRDRAAELEDLPAWLIDAELSFFAPAHRGFRPATWKALLDILPRWGEHMTSVPLLWRAYSEVQKDSTAILDLQRRTQELMVLFPALTALRARSLFGSLEDLVDPQDYDDDLELQFVEGLGHTEVCKPTLSYNRPLTFVCDIPEYYADGTRAAKV